MNLSNITVNKQSSIRIEGSSILYFDPFGIRDEKHDADLIFITHEHYDHFEPESIAKVIKNGTSVIAPESMKNKVLKELTVSENKCIFCVPDSEYETGAVTVNTVPAYNVMKPFHPRANGWLGYIVHMDGISYYVAGDTDVTGEARKVRTDVALLPIGGHYTMDKKQAAELVHIINPIAVIPTHYGEIVGSPADGEKFRSLVEGKTKVQVELRI